MMMEKINIGGKERKVSNMAVITLNLDTWEDLEDLIHDFQINNDELQWVFKFNYEKYLPQLLEQFKIKKSE